MKKMRMKLIAVFAVSALLLGGCGEPLYELTDSEEDIIVHYAAHALAKYNVFQKDGITNVSVEDTEETDSKDNTEEPETGSESTESSDNSGGAQTSGTGEAEVATISLGDSIGHGSDLEVSYLGYELSDSYQEGTYYAVSAPSGRTYLVMKFRMKNSGSTDVAVDSLKHDPSFAVTVGEKQVNSQNTILLNDFSSYQGTIAPGGIVDTVLLFEVTDEQAQQITGDPSFTVTVNGTTSAVAL